MSIPLLLRGVDLAAFAAALAARLRSAGVSVSASGQGGFVQAAPASWHRKLPWRSTGPPGSPWSTGWKTSVPSTQSCGEVFGSVQPGDTRSPESVLPIAGPKTPAATTAGILQPAASQSSNARAERLPWATRTVPDRDGAADAGILAARPTAQPHRRAGRRPVRPIRPQRSASSRFVAGGFGAALAPAPQPAIRIQPARQEDRPARDDERVTQDRLGSGDAGANAAEAPASARRAGLRRQPLDAAVRRDLSASDAGDGAATGRYSSRGVRVLDVADPAHPGAVPPLGRGGAGTGQREGHRPVRRHVHRSQHRRLAGARRTERAARRGGDHRIRRLGQRSAPRARACDGQGAAAGRVAVWLNPRAAHDEFQPLAGSMAAALPYCDLFLPAHSLTGLRQLFPALASRASRR